MREVDRHAPRGLELTQYGAAVGAGALAGAGAGVGVGVGVGTDADALTSSGAATGVGSASGSRRWVAVRTLSDLQRVGVPESAVRAASVSISERDGGSAGGKREGKDRSGWRAARSSSSGRGGHAERQRAVSSGDDLESLTASLSELTT
jgi:hypothetical protein